MCATRRGPLQGRVTSAESGLGSHQSLGFPPSPIPRCPSTSVSRTELPPLSQPTPALTPPAPPALYALTPWKDFGLMCKDHINEAEEPLEGDSCLLWFCGKARYSSKFLPGELRGIAQGSCHEPPRRCLGSHQRAPGQLLPSSGS